MSVLDQRQLLVTSLQYSFILRFLRIVSYTMGSDQNEIKEKLAGIWVLDRTDNFDEALKAMGK